jgi:hypothetical protein
VITPSWQQIRHVTWATSTNVKHQVAPNCERPQRPPSPPYPRSLARVGSLWPFGPAGFGGALFPGLLGAPALIGPFYSQGLSFRPTILLPPACRTRHSPTGDRGDRRASAHKRVTPDRCSALPPVARTKLDLFDINVARGDFRIGSSTFGLALLVQVPPCTSHADSTVFVCAITRAGFSVWMKCPLSVLVICFPARLRASRDWASTQSG